VRDLNKGKYHEMGTRSENSAFFFEKLSAMDAGELKSEPR